MDQQRSDVEQLAPDVVRLRIAYTNVYIVGPSAGADSQWTLVDTSLPVGAARILEVAAARFGRDTRPAAIVLTHGHFDHVGGLDALLAVWDVPVYAHALEIPFLTGRADYPPPDPTVGARVPPNESALAPERGIDLGNRVRLLPAVGSVPGMPGWRWVHTPGHSPGHVSFFRAQDRLLIAGDAATTTLQESVFSAHAQRQALNGPPASFTIDWDQARASVATIASLQPILIATGHGDPLRGPSVAAQLTALARDFDRRARPRRGRYVSQPAVVGQDGLTLADPLRSGGVRWGMLSGVAAAAFAGTWLYRRFGRRTREH